MFKSIDFLNQDRSFDLNQRERLGLYVYALIDPRDGKVFYVGQGSGDRVFSHFNGAESKVKERACVNSKEIRILDIWKNVEDVRWLILAHNLTEDAADAAEAAVIDAMSISPNGPCLNEIRGPKSSMLSEGEVTTLAADLIYPDQPISKVFLFPVHNALSDSRDNIYQATRASWAVASHNRSKGAYAVGIKNGISVGSFLIENWVRDQHKYAFTGIDEPLLVNYSWRSIIAETMGYWQRGNYLIVEFDGKGKFRFLRGSSKRDWVNL